MTNKDKELTLLAYIAMGIREDLIHFEEEGKCIDIGIDSGAVKVAATRNICEDYDAAHELLKVVEEKARIFVSYQELEGFDLANGIATLLDEACEKGKEEMQQITAQKEARIREIESTADLANTMLVERQREIAAMKEALSRQRSEVAALKKHGACPYVVSSDEGTQSCRLNGALESVLEAIEKELESIPESSYSFQWQENGYGRKPGNFFACEAEWETDTEDELCQGLGKTRIEAATACLEEIRRAKNGD